MRPVSVEADHQAADKLRIDYWRTSGCLAVLRSTVERLETDKISFISFALGERRNVYGTFSTTRAYRQAVGVEKRVQSDAWNKTFLADGAIRRDPQVVDSLPNVQSAEVAGRAVRSEEVEGEAHDSLHAAGRRYESEKHSGLSKPS